MIDLFCGRGGWTKGFLAHGWQVRGYDINPQPDYPKEAEFVQYDIGNLLCSEIRDGDFICASSPCEEFSVHCMKHFHPNPKWPSLGIELFTSTKLLCEWAGIPHVFENVRCAEKFVGKAVNHCGPFYLWGTGVPAVIPRECYQATKGIDVGSSKLVKSMTADERRAYRAQFKWNQAWSSSKQRGKDTAKAAEIPFSLASYIAQCATQLVDVSPK